MVQRSMKFTPEVLLSAPRRSAGVPNPSGNRVLYTTSTYDFQSHKKAIELRVLDAATGDSYQLAKDDDISDINWLDDDEFVCLQSEKNGSTSLYVVSVKAAIEKTELGKSHYIAGKIDAAAGNIKVCKLDPEGNSFAVTLSAQACPDGSLYTTEKSNRKTQSTGRLYSNLYVRHWDHYSEPQRNSLWFGTLSRCGDGKYELSNLTNALRDTGLECPIPPFGGTDHFDISTNRIIFVAKDPEVNPALNTKCNVYFAYLDSWTEGHAPRIQKIEIPGYEGACTSPVFAPVANAAAFLSMQKNGYEADRNEVFLILEGHATSDGGPKAEKLELTTATAIDADGDGRWDRSPQSICFSADGQSILAMAEDLGYGKLFQMVLKLGGPGGVEIRKLTEKGYVSDVHPLHDGRIFASGSSLVDNSWYAIVDPRIADAATEKLTSWSHSNSSGGSKFGLKPSQVSSIWTPASNPKVNKEVHSIVMKPSNFDPDQKYPVAYLIHGGPQGSWADSWSTRWNPAVFAEQGYIVIAPNPTGSTGYGQAFTDAIRKNWGGDPYGDIVNCYEWVGENMPEADNEKAVALGASYGGYMVS